jgi:hypothetical protein
MRYPSSEVIILTSKSGEQQVSRSILTFIGVYCILDDEPLTSSSPRSYL